MMQEQHEENDDVTPKNLPQPNRIHVKKLTDDQCKRYKAAGVLVLAKEPYPRGRTLMLLGKENRTKNRRKTTSKPYWLHFSGKREDFDNGVPQETALRELHEETAGALTAYWPMIVKQTYDDESVKVWDESSCYVLFVVYLPFPDLRIPSIFKSIKDTYQPKENYQTDLGWETPQERVEIYPFFALYLRTRCISQHHQLLHMKSLWRTCQHIGVEDIAEHVRPLTIVKCEEHLEDFLITLPMEPLEIVDIVNETSDDPAFEFEVDRENWRGFTWEHVWLFGKSWFIQSWETTKEAAAIKVIETLLDGTDQNEAKSDDKKDQGDDFQLVHYKNGKKRYVSSEDEKNLDAMSTLLKGQCWIYSKPVNASTEFAYETIAVSYSQ